MRRDGPAGHIAFFGHNAKDAAVRRRAVAMQRAGFEVTGFMPRRGPAAEAPFALVDLGETEDNAYARRIGSVFSGARRALAQRDLLARADLFYARNLDMLAMALLLRRRGGFDVPVVYECLDVHHKLTGDGPAARLLRGIEGRLTAASDLLVVSSPRFEEEHFRRHYPGRYRHLLVENRLIAGDAYGPRPEAFPTPEPGKLRLGWFGNLRCRRSLELMKRLARAYPDRLEIVLRGYPALSVIPDLDGEIAPFANIAWHGRYRAPEDLARIYGEVDAVWAGDWYEAGHNSLWLLPNRIYEGGYFGVPALAPDGTQTARWLSDHGCGLLVPEPVEERLVEAVGALLADPAPLHARRAALAALPQEVFVEPPEMMRTMAAMARAARSGHQG
ncbi:hypothetical protein [Celeribacter indicus]|uniref:Putative glycosyl transferase n=1 Tax=Celeribacter indicus TaxID=1208324 RepID=A0A0B5E414_9RHOB|nr:hypothetical protein [Celeribacter indicus]AJE47796.1 putative glycosyl transferase [Celeribacter indicus]SDW23183.1 succinoglycan biosynthesis protein ExoL [Celeribacter indicus]